MNNEILIGIVNRETSQTTLIPWTPEKIKFRSGNMQWAEYNIMDVGEVYEAIGRELRNVSWNDGVLPGPGVKDYPWQHAGIHGWRDPIYYQGLFSEWYQYKTPLTILVTHTPIFFNVKLDYYNITYKEANGSYHYDICFQEDREPVFVYVQPQPDVTDGVERDTELAITTYVIKDGDTLWGIAKCYLGDGLRYSEIYELNKEVIEQSARNHGRSDSCNGWWIYSGTEIKLPTAAGSSGGKSITLENIPIYISSDALSPSAYYTGTYYVYDGISINGRLRICGNSSDCGRKPVNDYVLGWVNESDIL